MTQFSGTTDEDLNTMLAEILGTAGTQSFAERLREISASSKSARVTVISVASDYIDRIALDLTVVKKTRNRYELVTPGALRPRGRPPFVGFRVFEHDVHLVDYLPSAPFSEALEAKGLKRNAARSDLASRGLMFTEQNGGVTTTCVALPNGLCRLARVPTYTRVAGIRPLPQRSNGLPDVS